MIAVAVLIGFALLAWGGVGGSGTGEVSASGDAATGIDDGAADADGTAAVDDGAAADDGSAAVDDGAAAADDGTGGDAVVEEEPVATTSSTIPARAPGEVKVAVANATDTAGLAGARSGELNTVGTSPRPSTRRPTPPSPRSTTSRATATMPKGLRSRSAAMRVCSGRRPAEGPDSLVSAEYLAAVEGFHVFVILGTDGVLG